MARERLDTGGRALGWVGLAACAGLVVVYLLQLRTDDPLPLPLLTGTLLAAVLFWSAIVRPAVLVDGDVLELRNMLETVRVPLAAIEDHALRQVLTLRVGDKKYVATGVGRSLRNAALGDRKRRGEPATPAVVNAADFVEARIGELAGDARDRVGIGRYSDEQLALARTTRRTPAWPVVAALVLTLAAFVLSLLA